MRKQMDEEIAKNKKDLEEMQKSWEQKVKDLEGQRDAEKVLKGIPTKIQMTEFLKKGKPKCVNGTHSSFCLTFQ